MLITPVDRPFNWKQPPRLSLGLSLVLLLIFVPWHLADLRLERELVQQYTQKLLATEWPLYETHALKTGQGRELAELKQDYAAGNMERIALYVGMDDGFVAAMQQSGQDYLTAERFSAWKQARADFDPQRSRLGGRALGLDPQQFRPITFLTFGLVQPGVVEMAVALLLLLTFGIATELALDSGAVLAGFLGGGVVGAFVFLAGNDGNVLPMYGAGVGASGIAGVFFMHFKQQKVRLANRFDVPAYALAALWLALVLVEFLVMPLRLPELAARIAALASGPLWYLAHQKWFAQAAEYMPVIFQESEGDDDLAYREQLNQALESVGRLEFATAQKQFREMLKAFPSDLRVLEQLYNIEKLNPAAPACDAVARRLFCLVNPASDSSVLQIYRDYQRISQAKTALDTDTSLKLVLRFTRMGEVMEADKLMRSILEKKATHPLLSKTAAALADAMDKLQEPARARFFRQVAAQG
jgi:membrane associated rhomboid family serine protease